MSKKPRKRGAATKKGGSMSKKRQSASRPPALPDRRAMEQQMAALGRALQDREFGSIDEINAYLRNLLATGGLPALGDAGEIGAATPLEQAQDIMYDAWQADGRRRVELARRALTISPDCADAYVLLAEETATSLEEARELYEQGVQAGTRALGPECFQEDAGHFWGILETRPYMRARAGLAECLWRLGERSDAIGHTRDLLRLNPGDNQGIRYRLLLWLLAEDSAAAGELLEQYEEDGSASWLYGRALYRFMAEGETEASNTALRDALGENPHVPLYLLGSKRLPSRRPAFIGLGDESEAVDYAAAAAGLWQAIPGARDWLRKARGKR